jgi:hypothetical protein
VDNSRCGLSRHPAHGSYRPHERRQKLAPLAGRGSQRMTTSITVRRGEQLQPRPAEGADDSAFPRWHQALARDARDWEEQIERSRKVRADRDPDSPS